jgi:DNA-binding NarL/FixJ family response regulator
MEARRMRVLVAHRLAATRLGIKLALGERGMSVCAETSRREGIARLAEDARPDVSIVDAGLPGGAVPAVRALSVGSRGAPVAVMGDLADVDGFLNVICAGASGYLPEAAGGEALVQTLTRIVSGEAVIPGVLVMALVELARGSGAFRSVVLPGRGRVRLSHRQSQVIALARQGHSTAEIASRLAIDPATVRQHLHVARRRLGASSRSAVLALAADASMTRVQEA